MSEKKEYSDKEIAAAMGKAIKTIRKEKGLSQSAVYLNAAIERNTFQQYDAGSIASPKMGNLIKIAEAMDITPADIVERMYTYLKEAR